MAALDLGALSYTLKLKKDNSWKSGFDEAGKDIKDYQKDIKESENANKTFQDSMKGFTGSLEMTGTIFDNLDKKLKLWMLNNKENASAVEINNKAIETNKVKLAELSEQLEKGNSVLKQVKSNFGENSEQYKKTENSILDLQIAYKKVEDETKRMEDSSEELKKSLNPNFFENLKNTIAGAMNGIGRSIKNGIGFSIGSDIWNKFKEGSMNILNFGSDAQKAMNQLQVGTGFADDSMKTLRQSMLDIYNDNFGEDFNDIAGALQMVAQQWHGNSSEIKGLTEGALALRDTFGYEIEESFRSANMLMQQFGMSGDKAYSMIAEGAQKGLDKNGDLLDSINEYSVQFKGLGLSAEDMFNMLQNGAVGGTFSVDKLGDAVKEFGIRAKDGSNTTQDAFQQLGLNVQQTEAKFAKGGDSAKKAFQQVNEKLLGLKDPLKQNQIGTELWGTMWEDLGKSGISSLTNMKGDIEQTGDALKEINKVKYNDLGSAFEGIKRNLQTGILLPMSNEVLPKLSEFSNWFTAHMPEIKQNVSSAMAVILPIVEKVFKLLGNGLSFLKQHSEGVKNSLIVLLPMLGGFAVIGGAVKAINNFGKALSNVQTAIGHIASAGKLLGTSFSKIASGAKIAGSNVASFAKVIGQNAVKGLKTGMDLAGKFSSTLLNVGKNALTTAGRIASMTGKIIAQGAAWIATNAKALIYKATNLALAAAEKIAAAAQAALNLVMSMNPIGLIIIAISGLIAAIVLLYRKNEWFRNMINAIWTNVKNVVVGAVNWIKNAWNTCINWFSTLPARLKTHAINMFVAFKNGAASIINSIGSWIKNKFQAFMNFFKNLPKQALQWGKDIVNQLKVGINNKINDVVNTAKNLGKKILDGIKGIFGIHSPSREMFKVGDYLVQGLQNGILNGKSSLQTVISKIFGGALSFAKGIFSNGDVKGWLTTALAITGQPMAALPALEAIAMHESGGNPNSINLWDSNAKAGHPSKGLMQTIDSTFNQYAIKGLGDIWNPVANAVAAIRYMLDQYGSIWNVPGIRNMASGGGYVGYASGTTSATKGWHITGENGPEMEWFNGGETVFNANDTQNILKIPGLIQVLINQIAKTGNLINSTINNLIISPNVLNKSMTATTVSPKDLSDNTIQIIVKDNTFLTKKSMDDFVSKISNTIYLNTKRRK